MELSQEQKEAAAKVTYWYHGGGGQVFRLFGYAGTGKTSTARTIVEQLGCASPMYAAYTGKAASVLRAKGCQDASTVHGLIYKPKGQIEAEIVSVKWRIEELESAENPDKEALASACKYLAQLEEKAARPQFVLNDQSALYESDLLILDEVSMIGHMMAEDLMGFGVKMLVLGDPAQLPPVIGEGFFIDVEPDHLMTQIHRSSGPISRLAQQVRMSDDADPQRGLHDRLPKVPMRDLLEYDQVLVGKNTTRWSMIKTIRRMQGRRSDMPELGDRIIVIGNNGNLDVFNGEQFTVLDVKKPGERRLKQPRHKEWSSDGLDLVVQNLDDPNGHPMRLPCWSWGFQDQKGERKAKFEGRKDICAATFAHAITVHKSQGSEWDRILVIDESGVFEGMRRKEAGFSAGRKVGRQWLYTAITRARQHVTTTDRGPA